MNYDKLNKRLDHMFAFENDNFFVNITLKDSITEKLFDYQFLHIFNLMTAFRSNKIILDGSDPGTGKTYTSIALCKQLGLRPFIICPKTIMSTWGNVCKLFQVNPLGIVNYESIKNGKYYDDNNKKIECNYIDVIELDEKTIEFKWNLPKNSLIIFDEVHKCKNHKSLNGKLLLSTINQDKVLMLSGTLADKPESFSIFGYMLGFYKNMRQSNNWIKSMIREDKSCINDKVNLSAINKKLYPDKGSRMRIVELGSKFPENQVSADCYYIGDKNKKEVNKCFQLFNEYDTKLKSALDQNKNANILKALTKSRQQLELIKIPIIKSLVEDYTDNGYNIAIFVNYTETIKKLSEILGVTCIVNGEESIEDRQKNIEKFQNNETNIIICNIAITEGLNLHDLHGVPRVSLISPSFRSDQLAQTLSRIHRAGAKTPALQRIIYCAGTCEEIICNRLKEKLKFMSKLNDNDLIKIE
ncbi:DEAD/SNF2-like helicase [Indivirus ILV1]|uniref:DEAD/SNF2-like helicase n=1 Tax=Indivirus ILV1 TaxID=1977633 RepID=A0A1V0SDV6_9VIRU|nr:DEAD/SNF2-like helicase [Indivirus ILV1]